MTSATQSQVEVSQTEAELTNVDTSGVRVYVSVIPQGPSTLRNPL